MNKLTILELKKVQPAYQMHRMDYTRVQKGAFAQDKQITEIEMEAST